MTTTPVNWEAQYERDFSEQKSSGPIVFTPEQRHKNQELFRRLRDLLPFQDEYKVSDCDLMYRFLIGKHWNVAAAEKGVRTYIEMRQWDHLDTIIGEQLHPTICAVHSPLYNDVPCPIYGVDKEGFPVLWLSPDANKLCAAMRTFTNDQLLRYQLRSMEMCRYVCLQRRVDRCTCVIDLGGVTMSAVNKATMSFLRGVMNLLQVAYPEIMRRLLIFNTGWAVSTAWKMLRPFVDARVQAKINFGSGPPTLRALEEHMTADQVHPSFGGTGSKNELQSIIDNEVQRIQCANKTHLSLESAATTASLTHRSSMEANQCTSLVNLDALPVSSADAAITPGTSFATVNDNEPDTPSSEAEWRRRVLIGMPGAVAAWLDRTNAAGISLSFPSNLYDEFIGSEAGPVTPIADVAAKRSRSLSPLLPFRHPSADQHAVPSIESMTTHIASGIGPAADQGVELPIVAISLTFLADGSISGYCGRQWVGCFGYGSLYAPAANGDKVAAQRSFSHSQASQQLPPDSGCPKCGMGVWAGEVLSEAGHLLHSHLIVSNAHRRARYLLRKSRLRARLTVYNFLGDAAVYTEKNKRHYAEGERAKLGTVVPRSDSTGAGGKENWMLYSDDVTRRLSRKTIHSLHFFSKTTPPSVSSQRNGGVAPLKKPSSGSWRASLLAAMRSGTSSTRGKSSSGHFEAPDSADAMSLGPHEQCQNVGNTATGNSARLLAECKGQTVSFYDSLTRHSLSDLFALAVAVTQLWNREIGGSMSQPTRCKNLQFSSDDDIVRQSIS